MKRKHLSRTQRAAAWRIAHRFLGHAMNGNEPFRGTDGMTDQLRTLHVGRRLGQRIFARCRRDSHLWVDRGICLVSSEQHAGKIGSALTGRAGWLATSSSGEFAPVEAPAVFAVIQRPERVAIRVREGFPSQRHARTWAFTPEGQAELRKAFLRIKPETPP